MATFVIKKNNYENFVGIINGRAIFCMGYICLSKRYSTRYYTTKGRAERVCRKLEARYKYEGITYSVHQLTEEQ